MHSAWVRSVGLETHATAGQEAGATVSCLVDAGQRRSMIEVCEEHLDIRVWDKRLSLTGW
jgi:hypothetical protein